MSPSSLRLEAFVTESTHGESLFVSHCPSLGLVSQGETVDQAAETMESAIRLYIRHAAARGTLISTLAKHRTPKAIFMPLRAWNVDIHIAQA